MNRCLVLTAVALLQGCTTTTQMTASAWKDLTAAPSPAPQGVTVAAQKFALLDSNGKPIAELGAAQGGSGLALMDPAGRPRAALILTGAGESGLKLYDQHGTVRAALVVAADGRSGLALYDDRGKDRAALVTTPQGEPGLVMFNQEGQPLSVLPASSIHQRGPDAR